MAKKPGSGICRRNFIQATLAIPVPDRDSGTG